VKKRDYDEQLRKEESKSVLQKSPSTSRQVGVCLSAHVLNSLYYLLTES